MLGESCFSYVCHSVAEPKVPLCSLHVRWRHLVVCRQNGSGAGFDWERLAALSCSTSVRRGEMASLSSPLRVCRGILKELRAIQGPSYRQSLAYNYVIDQFRKNKVTGERYCRAQKEAHHASLTYLCLLTSTRNHQTLHNLYHGKGERSPEEVAGLVGLRLPTQPGGKGWEK